MIISGAHVKRKNEISHDFLTLIDLAPTFYEVAGAVYPEKYAELLNEWERYVEESQIQFLTPTNPN